MIVIDATPLQTGHRHRGIGTYTASLLDALTCLSPRGFHSEPLGLLLQESRLDDLPQAAHLVKRPGVRVVPLSQRRWRYDRMQWLIDRVDGLVRHRPIEAALKGTQAHIYHATDPNGLVLVPDVATIATLYDLIPLHYPTAFFPPRWPDMRASYARYLRLLQRADRLIAISEATKRDAVERLHINPERIAVTPLAVDERRFYRRSNEVIDAALTRHSLRRPYFLYIGSSGHHKNAAAVVHAFSLFCGQGSVEHALYVTGAWEPRALADLQASYHRLFNTGLLRMIGLVPGDDLVALYSGADALVYPSLIEGFGLPVLEAMRCGTPVLTSNTSSLPEVGGNAVLYADPHSIDEMAAALQRLAGQPSLRADLAVRGLQRAALFSWTRTAEQTLRVYEELL